MTFAELVILLLLGVGIFYSLAPLQKRLARRLYPFFRAKNPPRRSGFDENVIDVTDSLKKEKNNDKNGL